VINEIEVAIQNNVMWCDIVCDSHGIGRSSTGHLWGLLSSAPPCYPDIMTLDKNATIQEIHDFIGTREIRSIKDSFANLDCHFWVLSYCFPQDSCHWLRLRQ
jgi:hypothetical protein